jgi:RNA polymerase sigma factor FliA
MIPHPTPTCDSPDVLARFRQELPLVELNARQVAAQLGPGPTTLDDLRSFGQEGLLAAARSFDASRGLPFRRWANLRIKGAMADGLRRWGALPRRIYRELKERKGDGLRPPLKRPSASKARQFNMQEGADFKLALELAHQATNMAMGMLFEEARVDVDDLVDRKRLIERVRAIVARLPQRQQSLIERHYFDDENSDRIALSLGISKSWASRLHVQAIETITSELRRPAGGLLASCARDPCLKPRGGCAGRGSLSALR